MESIHVASPPFVSVAELAEWLKSEAPPKLVDARAPVVYKMGHLPGAVNLDVPSLNTPVGGVRQLVSAEALAARCEELGLDAGPIVVYGMQGGSDAAHVWWTLTAYNHPAVYLLDGGVEAWQAAGHELSQEAPALRSIKTPFTPRLDPQAAISREELLARLEDPNLAIVDTRRKSEFYGQEVAARRGGHIPGAILQPWNALLKPAQFSLENDEALRDALGPLLERPEVAFYCQSGVRAAHALAVLKKLGHPKPRLYLGSWADWGNQADTPVDR